MGLALSNIFARDLSDYVWEFPSVTSVIACAVFFRVGINSCEELMAASVDLIFVIMYFEGNKFTVSEILSDTVLGI